MITVGSVSREEAARKFYFLQEQIHGRRKAVNELTHKDPDFVFWIFPDGQLFDAKDAHIRNYPKGCKWILDDEPDYWGFLRGRVATSPAGQLVVVYCRPEALAYDANKIGQFLDGMSQLPVPLAEEALVISDNGDVYGTMPTWNHGCRDSTKGGRNLTLHRMAARRTSLALRAPQGAATGELAVSRTEHHAS